MRSLGLMAGLLVLGVLMFPATCPAAAAGTLPVMQIDRAGAVDCPQAGVMEREVVWNLPGGAVLGREAAKLEFMDRARDMGATDMVWEPAGFLNPGTVKGVAYRCP